MPPPSLRPDDYFSTKRVKLDIQQGCAASRLLRQYEGSSPLIEIQYEHMVLEYVHSEPLHCSNRINGYVFFLPV